MASEHTIGRYRILYARLLGLYPKAYRERFGEGMKQTFNDLCRDRSETESGLFGFVLWIFVETTAGIFRENILTMSQGNKRILYIALGTLGLLVIPMLGNRFVEGWDWSLGDFVLMGVIIFSSGLFYELVSRAGNTTSYRAAVGIGVVTGFLLIWINLAVGIIGSEDNPANALYMGVLMIGLMGAAVSRLRPRGMSQALFVTAIAQFLVPVIALIIWRPSFDDPPGMLGVFMLNSFFAMLFFVSGLLFRYAGETVPQRNQRPE